jgi:hypothetical protein
MQPARRNQVFQQDHREKASFWRGAAFRGKVLVSFEARVKFPLS